MARSMTAAMTSNRRRGSRRRTLIFVAPMKSVVPSACAARSGSPCPLARAHAIALAIVALGSLPTPASAQEAAAAALPEMVVTATRVPTRADELVSDTVVIDRAQIEQQASRTLPEILARMAGVQISANGGLGKGSSVYIRGAEARHTIFMIDGVRYDSATLGTPVWDNIPVELIDRIEVVKGPGSALYGLSLIHI